VDADNKGMDSWLDLFEDLLWWVPWRDPLGKGRALDRRTELRLRVALENELQRRDDGVVGQPGVAQ
jgi:hypothetical protein